MRKNRAADFLAPAVLAQPRHSSKGMAFALTVLLIRIAFVIHVVQQSNRFPKIDIRAAQVREMFH